MNYSHSISLYRIWIVGMVLMLASFGLSCNITDNNDDDIPDFYYVNYEVTSTTNRFGQLETKIKTESDTTLTLVINSRVNWGLTIGPVERGFEALISISDISNDNSLTISPSIYVSKNNGPFAIKAIDQSDNSRSNVELSYVVDF